MRSGSSVPLAIGIFDAMGDARPLAMHGCFVPGERGKQQVARLVAILNERFAARRGCTLIASAIATQATLRGAA